MNVMNQGAGIIHFVKLNTQVRTQLYTAAALSRQLERPWRATFTSKPTSSNLRDARTASTPARPLRENSASDATAALHKCRYFYRMTVKRPAIT